MDVPQLKRLCTFILAVSLVGTAACTSTCDNAGATVDGLGNIVVRGENGFISPNSTVLRNVKQWPQPPSAEENFAFSQGYTLIRDGAMYVLENTAYHPNLVYRIDLADGHAAPIGGTTNRRQGLSSNARSSETWIAASDRYVYSVDQVDATIRRADLSAKRPTLTAFIQGPRTRLRSPIAVAVDKDNRLCALDSRTSFLLCYAADSGGNVAPARAIDLKKFLGYAQVGDLAFDRSGRIVVTGTSDPAGLRGFSIAVVDVTARIPQLVRSVSGPNARLLQPEVAVDALGNILVLQRNSPNLPSGSEILAFGPAQHGDVAPESIRNPAASVTRPFRIAVDRKTDDVAILGSSGVALFSGAARKPPNQWPSQRRLPVRGWSVAFGASSLVVADEFGDIQKYSTRQTPPALEAPGGPLSLHDPDFISTDQDGRIYVASTVGVITAFPKHDDEATGWRATSFSTPFGRNMNAFAADSAGYFYLSSPTNDAIVKVDADGDESVIAGSNTRLNRPLGLAVNRNGDVYVANTSGRSILIFQRGSTGNAAPIGEIAGAATKLMAPQALAIAAGGKLYVFDGPQTTSGFGAAHYVRVYDSTARGNAAPLQSYPVQTKCWANAP